jgi:hypothetical protein
VTRYDRPAGYPSLVTGRFGGAPVAQVGQSARFDDARSAVQIRHGAQAVWSLRPQLGQVLAGASPVGHGARRGKLSCGPVRGSIPRRARSRSSDGGTSRVSGKESGSTPDRGTVEAGYGSALRGATSGHHRAGEPIGVRSALMLRDAVDLMAERSISRSRGSAIGMNETGEARAIRALLGRERLSVDVVSRSVKARQRCGPHGRGRRRAIRRCGFESRQRASETG